MITLGRAFPSCRGVAAVVRAACLLCAFGAALIAATPADAGPRAYALAGNTLLPFDLDHPQHVGAPIAVTGLVAGDTLVGIDFRPMNGHLYGLAIDGNGGARLYHISFRTGLAAEIGRSGRFLADDGVTPVPIRGRSFGIDFDPAIDRLRVTNDAGQNFLMDPNDGAFVDSNANAPGINMNPPMEGFWPDAAAYTNYRQDTTSTTLYTLSSANDALYVRRADNPSAFAYVIPLLLHGTRIDVAGANGFDILPGVDVEANGLIAVGKGYALLRVAPGSGTELYTIDLTTGVTELVGFLGDDEASAISGLAVQGEEVPGGLPTVVVTPKPAIFGTTFPSVLFRFNTSTLGSAGPTGAATITGLRAGELIAGIDYRPQTGQLFAVTIDPDYVNPVPREYVLRYRLLDPLTGALADFIGAERPQPIDAATGVGFDFDPTSDRVRVLLGNGQHYWRDPDFFRIEPPTEYPRVNGLPAGSTGVTAAAYTNSFGQTADGNGPATLYTLDAGSDQLFIQHPPNSGTQTQAIPITLNRFPVALETPLDFSSASGFDIPASVRVSASGAPATGTAYAALTVDGVGAVYAINLGTGVATRLGVPAIGIAMTGLALGDGPPTQTTVSLSSSPATLLADQQVTLTANVIPASATGTISFRMNGTGISGCEAQPIAAGRAVCTATLATAGAIALSAVYDHDELHLPATGTLVQHVSPLATTTTARAALVATVTGRAVTFTASVLPAAATGMVTFFVDGVSAGTAAVTNGRATVTANNVSSGVHQITAGYGGDATFASSSSAPSVLTIDAPGPLTQYFAEGAGGFFQTQIGILNASATAPAHITVWLYPEGGAPVELLMTLAPLARQTLDLDTVVDHEAGVSVLVTADQPIAATRHMTWGDPIHGSTLESGIPSTSPAWYFAEGATDHFSLYYLLQNPGATAATVTLTHLLEGGASPVVHEEVVPPFSRRTVHINAVPGLARAALSTHLTANVPIVAERAMYLNGRARLWEGGASGRGATALSPTWSFAEGATGFFHTYLLVGNPNSDAATVTVRYQLPSGATITRAYDVAGRSRRTIDVNLEDPQLASTAVGMTVTASHPIVAERAMWWGFPAWVEGSAALGSIETGYVWGIGEGAEGGAAQESTFVLVTNASGNAGVIQLTVSYDDGTQQQKEYALAGHARLTVRIGDDFANARGGRFSAIVESLTDGMPIGVDVARYQSADGFMSAGGATTATRIVR